MSGALTRRGVLGAGLLLVAGCGPQADEAAALAARLRPLFPDPALAERLGRASLAGDPQSHRAAVAARLTAALTAAEGADDARLLAAAARADAAAGRMVVLSGFLVPQSFADAVALLALSAPSSPSP